MTKQEENRIKMALYDGATWIKDKHDVNVLSYKNHLNPGIARWEIYEDNIIISYDVPDYYKDYEAIRQFIIKHFRYPNSQTLWNVYWVYLDDIIARDLGISKLSVSFGFESTIASIEQMIEAVVKTLDQIKNE